MLSLQPRTTRSAVASLALAAVLCPSPSVAQSSSMPGAMKPDGNFFVTTQYVEGPSLATWVWEYNGSAWISAGVIWNSKLYSPGPERPAAVMPGGTSHAFHVTQRNPANWPQLNRWTPTATGWPGATTYLGAPSLVVQMSPPSEVMYGNRVYVVGEGPFNSGSLYERFSSGSGAWLNFGHPLGRSLRLAAPCVLRDGKLFMASDGGELIEMWRNGNSWHFSNHGRPLPWLNVELVGAPMPLTDKLFATCSDGTLWQRYWHGAGWTWFSHQRPAPGFLCDSAPVTVFDGKLFVTARHFFTGVRRLFELYWNGAGWSWYDHGAPSGTNLLAGAATSTALLPGISSRIAVKGTNGSFYLRYYDPGTARWLWQSCGSPPW
ncbi:MAG TPA: hypothetical protein PKC43_02825 [Phycisphaerales bacterium]|nr:hypothetical protein [Phycisphaerales bacterium]HMP36360.1 hypothetical protein [Phycisphaerales bacterium]